ncbi:aminoglycoside 3'-phosphotransferase/choline kinase family protein [Methylobacterium sp. J-072]|uniref:aminoglycoside phosphotransferase family protein n=1 Tax=Methylobacterium sp. J-072 TaxID=2836651 RepID=UPI001FBAB800|nr:aminoglycoside 3'-phosphotransferase/choline kinase family protein [Methylobacterium sp. J-072]MCJ2091856.1 aminoglycoside 3'-phosphotransferase/choline kinase family protein [Methylobacterium sp. J-072]
MIAFPVIADKQAFASWRAAPNNWHTLVNAIARASNVVADEITPFQTGTNLVVGLNDSLILKLFPPIYHSQFISERATLRLLSGKLSVPIPRLVAEGERSGWSYLVMTRLHGILGSEAWPTLSESEKVRVLAEIGRTIAEMQAVPPGDLAAIEPTWPDFVARQVTGCIERHRRQGLAPNLLADLDELLRQVPSVVPLDAPPVILTGEWIPENFLLAETDGRWHLAALIDFGDVMTGWREYDLLGPSAFMCAGLPGRVASLMRGYGLRPDALDAAMRRRLLTLMLLHRASDLRHIDIDGWEARAGRLVDLENVVWPVDRGR